MYYNLEELSVALNKATDNINYRTIFCKEYTRGINDCFALLFEYDMLLRSKSKANEFFKEPWNSSKGWFKYLYKSNHTIESYAEYCGYEIIKNKRPKLGDIAFEKGSAMIAGDGFWHSTCENNSGVNTNRQIMFVERHLTILARPRKIT